MTINKYGWSYHRPDRNSSLSVNDVPDTFRVCSLENGHPNLDNHLLLTANELAEVSKGENLVEHTIPEGNGWVEVVVCFTDPVRFKQFAYNFSLGFADLDC